MYIVVREDLRVKVPERFTPEQEARLGDALREGRPPVCPGCGGPLDQRPIPPRADVSYVRDRVWLVCPTCSRSAVLDRRGPG